MSGLSAFRNISVDVLLLSSFFVHSKYVLSFAARCALCDLSGISAVFHIAFFLVSDFLK